MGAFLLKVKAFVAVLLVRWNNKKRSIIDTFNMFKNSASSWARRRSFFSSSSRAQAQDFRFSEKCRKTLHRRHTRFSLSLSLSLSQTLCWIHLRESSSSRELKNFDYEEEDEEVKKLKRERKDYSGDDCSSIWLRYEAALEKTFGVVVSRCTCGDWSRYMNRNSFTNKETDRIG